MLKGVTNGINPDDFNPEHAEKQGIAAPFSPAKGDLAGKRLCRRDLVHLLSRQELPNVRISGSLSDEPDLPLFTLIGRLTEQKGVDLLVSVLRTLLPEDKHFQILILGTGVKEIELDLTSLADIPENRGRVCIVLGYDQQLANKIYAAGDFFLIPSRYEPCGLTDYIAQLFGNLPVVHHVGGLVKVEDGKTGFAYHKHSAAALMGAMEKALATFRRHPEKITAMQRKSIKVIHNSYTWDKIVLRYMELYQEALALCSRQ
jgi:starch synthase